MPNHPRAHPPAPAPFLLVSINPADYTHPQSPPPPIVTASKLGDRSNYWSHSSLTDEPRLNSSLIPTFITSLSIWSPLLRVREDYLIQQLRTYLPTLEVDRSIMILSKLIFILTHRWCRRIITFQNDNILRHIFPHFLSNSDRPPSIEEWMKIDPNMKSVPHPLINLFLSLF